MSLLAKLEFESANIDRVINLNNYTDYVVLTVVDNDAELAFGNGYVSHGRVLEKFTNINLNCLIDSQVFKQNHTKYQIAIRTNSASITAVKMKKLH